MKEFVLMVAVVLAMPVAQAGETVSREEGLNASAASWLALQRSGSQASPVSQTLTPVIQERVVKRYLDSFNAPIPVFFTEGRAEPRAGGR